MDRCIYETDNFKVLAPTKPYVGREDGIKDIANRINVFKNNYKERWNYEF